VGLNLSRRLRRRRPRVIRFPGPGASAGGPPLQLLEHFRPFEWRRRAGSEQKPAGFAWRCANPTTAAWRLGPLAWPFGKCLGRWAELARGVPCITTPDRTRNTPSSALTPP